MADESRTNDLVFDLRVTYAVLVQQHLVRITFFRFEDNYPKWLESIENLWIITQHKLTRHEGVGGVKIKVEKIETLIEEYNTLYQKALTLINNNKNVFFGKQMDSKVRFEIRAALSAIEIWLYKKMDEANMFGGRRDFSGLM